jgi:hypothetical protein
VKDIIFTANTGHLDRIETGTMASGKNTDQLTWLFLLKAHRAIDDFFQNLFSWKPYPCPVTLMKPEQCFGILGESQPVKAKFINLFTFRAL